MALLDVLHGAHQANEDQIYDEGKRRLNSIHETVRGLEQALPVDSIAPGAPQNELSARRRVLLVSTLSYRNAATSAITMATTARPTASLMPAMM